MMHLDAGTMARYHHLRAEADRLDALLTTAEARDHGTESDEYKQWRRDLAAAYQEMADLFDLPL